ncbi:MULTISPECIES: type II toxin-antitoxin system HipA family toxin [unclassified Sphingomonas]|uniref:type II toxin-antitoxin system HipA family toxin n=1 Tax=unclassified Sphingomonas TaxID=196159 RepID=UPI00082FC431|nr:MULTISPECIES: HipA domain-containing protein [unclassified Sphingomonas]
MIETRALDIHLADRKVGTLVALEGDRTIFSFAEDYVADAQRPTLSLGYRDTYGALINEPRAHRVRLEPFFSNLLPEGALKDYLARQVGVKAVREFQLLAALGGDLPGAVRAVPSEVAPANVVQVSEVAVAIPERFRFSLAGVQLKFSALKNQGKKGGLTIAVSDDGGEWIVKLPSTNFASVPENEYSVMTLARLVGIDVPEIELLPLHQIEGLPEGINQLGESAFAIRRFDRSTEGRIHIEDFAQVFSVYPDDKYDKASYRNILEVLADATDEQSVDQFIRRLTFSVLIGNGDMHLKNWSLIYPDGRRPILSPAYDLLSTIAYLPGEQAALKFRRSKDWSDFNEETLVRLADKARIAATPVLKAARETIERFDAIWTSEIAHLPMPSRLVSVIEKHRRGLVI